MKILMSTEDGIRFKYKLWEFMRNHPAFARDSCELTMDEQRHQATIRQFVIFNEKFFNMDSVSV